MSWSALAHGVGCAVARQSNRLADGALGAVLAGRVGAVVIGVSGVVKAFGAMARVGADCVLAFLAGWAGGALLAFVDVDTLVRRADRLGV